jgi:tRNA(Ile2)-agmatinylcytidine synthase
MIIGIDDTDSPQGMCTTYLGAVLARRLIRERMKIREARLVRLNPNVTWKTRGNAAIALDIKGDGDHAFAIACATVEEFADFSCNNTNPGVVVVDKPPDPAFYKKAVTDFCQIDEAIELLEAAGAHYRGYKNRRGLIGATAAVASVFEDHTSEILVYRRLGHWGTSRDVNRQSLFDAEQATFPHTWDTVDTTNDVVVCVPHTPDPVLFGIRGESPSWVMSARKMVLSEKPGIEQIWVTNEGTDAHILTGRIGDLLEGLSYRVQGIVADAPSTMTGGHVSFTINDGVHTLRCMAYEPTKNFRQIVRQLMPGDAVIAVGSYKKGSINLEKIRIISLTCPSITRPPLCIACNKRMTSDGTWKGYKCKKCGARAVDPDVQVIPRNLTIGWYEVPPTARRHLAKPLCRGEPDY